MLLESPEFTGTTTDTTDATGTITAGQTSVTYDDTVVSTTS